MLGVSLTGTSAHPTTTFVGMTTIDGTPTANGVFGPIGGATARTVMDLAMEPFRHSASGPNSPPHLNNNSFALKASADDKKDPRKVRIINSINHSIWDRKLLSYRRAAACRYLDENESNVNIPTTNFVLICTTYFLIRQQVFQKSSIFQFSLPKSPIKY